MSRPPTNAFFTNSQAYFIHAPFRAWHGAPPSPARAACTRWGPRLAHSAACYRPPAVAVSERAILRQQRDDPWHLSHVGSVQGPRRAALVGGPQGTKGKSALGTLLGAAAAGAGTPLWQ